MAASALLGSCNLHNPGLSLPEDELSYPKAMVLSPGDSPRFLYVANTNFDIRYNSASVHSYDLAALEAQLVASRCRRVAGWADGGAGSTFVPDNTRYPGASLDAGAGLDAGGDDAQVASDGSVEDGAVIASPEAGITLDGSAPADIAPADIELPSEYTTVELGNSRGTLCSGTDNAEVADDCCFDLAVERNRIRRSDFKIDSIPVGIGISADERRLYVPVSSKNQLVYFDVADGEFSCGDQSSRCVRGPRQGGPDQAPDEKFPGTLSAMATGKLSELIAPGAAQPANPNATYIATTHELGGFGLFIDDGEPALESVGRQLPQHPRAIVADPSKHLLYVASANVATIARLGVRVSPEADLTREGSVRKPGPRELVYQGAPIALTGLAQSTDIRDIVIDPDDSSLLYLLVRGTQESVAFVQLDPDASQSGARLIDAVRVGQGPSKMVRVELDGRPFLLVSCYDAKAIYIVDPRSRKLVSVVRSLSGPFEMVFDASRKTLHVTDFRASVMRVVDLAGLTDKRQPPPRVIATIGAPSFKGGI